MNKIDAARCLTAATVCLIIAACGSGNQSAPEATSGAPTEIPAAAGTTPAAMPPAASSTPTLEAWTGWSQTAVRTELCSLDAVNGVGSVAGLFSVTAFNGATFEGWSSTVNLQNPGQIRVYLDGPEKFQVNGSTGVSRNDVAQAHGVNLSLAGFKLEISEMPLPVGEYAILIGHTHNGIEGICDTKTKLMVQ